MIKEFTEARDPNTKSARLSVLAKKSDELARLVLYHPNVSAKEALAIWGRLTARKKPRFTTGEIDEALIEPLWKEASAKGTTPARFQLLAGLHDSLARLVARNPATPPALLTQLTTHPDEQVACGAAQNSSTPEEALFSLALGTKRTIRQAIASRAEASPGLLARLLQYGKKAVLRLVALRPELPAEVAYLVWSARNPEGLRWLFWGARQRNEREGRRLLALRAMFRRQVSDNNSKYALPEGYTPDALAETLFSSLTAYGRELLASDRWTPPAFLARLARDANPAVRERAARNANTPTESLRVLAKDQNATVRARIAFNTSAPREVLEVVAKDARVISMALNREAPPRVRSLLFESKSLAVRSQAVARLPMSIEDLRRLLSTEKNPSILTSNVNHPAATDALREEMARAFSHHTRAAVASSYRTMPALLAMLAEDESIRVRTAVAGHTRTPGSALRGLAQDKSVAVRTALARNGATPAETLRALSEEKNKAIREALLYNPNTPDDALVELIKKEKQIRVGWLWQLAKRRSHAVKFAVIEHPNISDTLLQRLAASKAEPIQRAATERLRTRTRK